jgi:hypothetical protein
MVVPHQQDPHAALLAAFMAGETEAREQLPGLLDEPLLDLARRFAPRLAPDLQREVVQQALELLLRKKQGAFDPSRGTAISYLTGIVHTAARDVKAVYHPPGSRTRARASEQPQEPLSFETVVTLEEDGEAVRLGETLPVSPDPIRQLEGRMVARKFVESIIKSTSPAAGVAAAMIAFYTAGVAEAADAIGLSRFQLHRQLHEWGEMHPEMRIVA